MVGWLRVSEKMIAHLAGMYLKLCRNFSSWVAIHVAGSNPRISLPMSRNSLVNLTFLEKFGCAILLEIQMRTWMITLSELGAVMVVTSNWKEEFITQQDTCENALPLFDNVLRKNVSQMWKRANICILPTVGMTLSWTSSRPKMQLKSMTHQKVKRVLPIH